MYCSNCGTPVNDNDKFCPECGAPVEPARQEPREEARTAASPAPAPVSEPTSAPKKKTHKALWIALICIALALIAAAVAVFAIRPWEKCAPRTPAENPAATNAPVVPDVTALPVSELDPEEAIRRSFEALNDAESMHLDFTEDIALTIGVSGVDFSRDIDMSVVLGMDMQRDPALSRADGTVKAMGQEMNLLVYSETVDGATWTYSSQNGGKTWTREKNKDLVEGSIMADPAQSINLWMKHAKDLKKTGVETINGCETTVYSGMLSGEYVQEATDMTGELFGAFDDAELLKDLDDLPIMFWIDNGSGRAVRIVLDMRDMMKTLLERAMNAEADDAAQGIEIECDVKTARIECNLSQFDAVSEIVIPDEARGVRKDGEAPEPDGIVGTWTLCGGEDEETQQAVSMMLAFGMEMELTFNEDGTGAMMMHYAGEEQDETFSYVVEDGQIVIDGSGADFRIEDGMLHITIEDMGMIFTRQ